MKQILIVDDEKLIREMLSSRLEDQGYEPILAKDGKEGLKLFKQHNPAVTILDLKMPVMDGIEFLNQLDPGVFLTNAIIVFTGHGDNNDIEQCYKLGVQSFLRKPVNFYELQGAIQRAFNLVKNSQEVNNLNRRLQESNQRISSILDNIPDLIWECDQNLEFTYISDNISQVLQYEVEELIGKKITEIVIDDDKEQINYKFKASKTTLREKAEGLAVTLKTKNGDKIPMQLLAKGVLNELGKTEKLLVTARDMKMFAALADKLEETVEPLLITVEEKIRKVSVNESVRKLLGIDFSDETPLCDLETCLADPDSTDLVNFAFTQKEDVPFPIEFKLKDTNGDAHLFTVKLSYDSENASLTGALKPVGQQSQLKLMFKQVDQRLANSVEVTSEMKSDILKDAFNLSGETLACIKTLSDFAYQEEELFHTDEFFHFLKSKNVGLFMETLKVIGNKVHGLKGTTGFILPPAKSLCHHLEEILQPLLEYKLVFTNSIYRIIVRSIYAIQDMLDKYQEAGKDDFSIDELLQAIDGELKRGVDYLGNQVSAYTEIITKRGIDAGEIRKRRTDEYLSVSQAGYEQLSQQVKSLFYMFSETLSDEHIIQAGNLYNEFLDTHQRIQKVPLDLSRYERLIPSLAKQYEKEALFVVNDHGVHADREFWNAIHEILNHTLKNSVIHGLERADEREHAQKDSAGAVSVEIKEDALSIYVTVSDDGKGIDLAKIRKKALENMVVTPEKLDMMTDDEVLHLVFVQGVSTVDDLDDNAGRGVGMNAVQEAMQTFQGSCKIKSEQGKGCSWYFTFPKSNVSLSCFIVTVDDFRIAIPEDCVEAFYGYQEQNINWINQQPSYRQNEDLIPLLDTATIFDKNIAINGSSIRRVLILKTEEEKMGMVINDIIHHANMPIMALPEEYRNIPSYLGATLYGNEPVLVINAGQIR